MIKYNMTEQKKYHYMYRTTCTLTGRFYVGMHSTDNLKDGYLGSGKILGYSRKKYGDENHSIEILEFLPSRKELKVREAEIVNEELLSDPLCMNLKFGGEGGWAKDVGVSIQDQNVDVKARGKAAAKTKTQRRQDLVYREALRQTLSAAHAGEQNFLGKSHTEESRKKISRSMQGKQDGKKNSQFGTIWVTDGTNAIKIDREQLYEYECRGYSRGRNRQV